MSTIQLVRTNRELPPESDLQKVREFLFGVVDGARQDDRKLWNRFWRRIVALGSGELARIEFVFPRNSKYHRKFFALLNVGFEAWDPGRKRKTYKGKPIAKNFEQFRKDVTILAGHYEQTFDLQGRMKLIAKSISFSKMDDAEFEAFYSDVADVLLGHVLTNYAGREQLDEVVDKIVGFL